MERQAGIPPHLWETIFQKITDPKKLLKLQLISKDLRPLVESALKQASWKQLCENDIGYYALSTIVKSILPKTSYDDLNDITLQSKWMKVYYSYLNWYKCLNNDKPLRQFSTKSLMWNRFLAHDKNNFTCLDVWSSYIAGGSTKGTIYIFANFFLIKPYFIINTGNHQINKVKLWFTASRELLVVTLDIHGYVRFWDVKQKVEKFANMSKITDGIDLYVNTSCNLFVVKQSQVLRLQLLPTSKNELKLSQCDVDLAEERCRILSLNFFDPHKISVLVRSGSTFILYTNILNEPEGLNMSNVQPEIMPYLYVDPDARWPFFGFNNQSLMFINDSCLIILNRFDYWKTFPMKTLFGGTITSIAWHGHYFLLGFIYGEIRIFYIENLAYLEEDIGVLYNTQLRTIKLDPTPVLDIKISHILDMPIIIATTENHIHKIALEK